MGYDEDLGSEGTLIGTGSVTDGKRRITASTKYRVSEQSLKRFPRPKYMSNAQKTAALILALHDDYKRALYCLSKPDDRAFRCYKHRRLRVKSQPLSRTFLLVRPEVRFC